MTRFFSATLVLMLAACGPGGVDAARSELTAERATAVANGTDGVRVTVTVRDASGNPLSDVPVSLAFTAVTAGAIHGAAPTTDARGEVHAHVMTTVAGPYTLVATAAEVELADRLTLTFQAGPATKLGLGSVGPSTTAGVPFAPAVQAFVLDAFDNVVLTASGEVTVETASGAALSGATTVAVSGGVATFTGLAPTDAGEGDHLVVSAPGLAEATSAEFAVVAGSAAQLVFTEVADGPFTAGQVFAAQVHAQDAFGNLAAEPVEVTVTLEGGLPDALLSSERSTPSPGVSDFSLSVRRAASGYRLRASAPGLTAADSAPFTVHPSISVKLGFERQPGTAQVGRTISPAVRVVFQDAFGNRTTDITDAVIVLSLLPEGSATLSGGGIHSTSDGSVTFDALSVDTIGTGYVLRAVSNLMVELADSTPFDVTAEVPDRLAFTGQPSSGVAGASLGTVRVELQDGNGVLLEGRTDVVTLSLNSTAGGALSGTVSRAAVGGVATFTELAVQHAATGYSLSADASGFEGATSEGFDVAAGAAASLLFTGSVAAGTAGAALPALVVAVHDAFGNPVTAYAGSVSLTLASSPVGATLPTTTVTASGGAATFNGVTLTRAGSYSLRAAASGLTSTTTGTFQIAPAAASRLVFTVQPTSTRPGTVLAPAVQVSIQDGFGNLRTADTTAISLALVGAATLGGDTTVDAVAGVATFGDLTVDSVGTGYRLQTSGVGDPVQSAAFNVATRQTVEVATSGFSFSPANVTLRAGDSVHWTITGFHNVMQVDSASSTARTPGGFYSGAGGATSSYTFQFDVPGTFHYICEVHGTSMRGTVTVNP